jgi:hypothetical protein
MRPVGVSSSHLQCCDLSDEDYDARWGDTHRNVLPKTESINLLLIILEALIVP